MLSVIKKIWASLRRNERGNITIETIYVVPLIMWTTLALAIVWEYHRAANAAQRATIAVADIVSRERNSISSDLITKKYLRTFGFINGLSTSPTVVANTNYPAAVRVTSIIKPAGTLPLEVSWSMSSNLTRLPQHTNATIAAIANTIPTLFEGDSIVLVETSLKWSPRITSEEAAFGPLEATSGWVSARTINISTAIRPRFVPRLCATFVVGAVVTRVPCEL